MFGTVDGWVIKAHVKRKAKWHDFYVSQNIYFRTEFREKPILLP